MNEEQLNAVFNSLADAIRTAVTEAVQTSRPQSVATEYTNSQKPPPFAMGAYKSADGSTVADYFASFDWALKLSKIAQEDYHSYARVHMGGELNTALRILISPKKPEELSYEEIKSILTNHYDGKKNIYAESFKFRQIRQEVGEPLSTFALRLKQAAATCDYGAFLDRMLIEQMIFGIESRSICDEVIAKQPKSFAEAYEIASSKDLTQLSTSMVNTGDSNITEPTCKLGFIPVKTKNDKKQRPISTAETNCYGCGGRHARKDCKFKNAKCFTCGKGGHISKVCRANTRHISDSVETDENEVVHTYQITAVKTNGVFERKMVTMNVDGKKVEMELDTGAPCSIISLKNLRKIKKTPALKKSDRRFSSYTGHKITCIGRTVVNVSFGRIKRRLNLYVVDADLDTLCGREWIAHFAREINFTKLFQPPADAAVEMDLSSATKATVAAISMEKPNLSNHQQHQLQQLLSKHEDIFSKVAGTFRGSPIKVHLKADATPKFARPREIPFALRDAYARRSMPKSQRVFTRE